MKKIILLLIFLVNSFYSHAQDSVAISRSIKANLPEVTKLVRAALSKSRYMEGTPIPTTTQLEGYKGIPVKLYRYNWNYAKNLVAYVYLLDADNERIARWLISAACWARGRYDLNDVKKLLATIEGQSGAQFPVLGVVLENDEDSFVSPYIYFKDGITVAVKKEVRAAFKFDTTYITTPKNSKKMQITFAPENLPRITNDNLSQCYYKGRIISTTRQEYKQAGGKLNVDGLNFMRVVRDEYLKALKSDYNFLIYARAKDLLK